MSLLVDYSKYRADISSFPEDSQDSFSWNTDDGHDSFAYDNSHGSTIPPAEASSFSKLGDDSVRTISTAEASSESSFDELYRYEIQEAPVSFRLKRSSMGMGSSAPAQEQGYGTCTTPRMSRSERFDDSMATRRQSEAAPKTTTTLPVPYRRTATAPSRVNSGDSLQTRLQYAAWKRRRGSLLSASAEIATSSDRDLFHQRPTTRRGSMPHLSESQDNLLGTSDQDHQTTPQENTTKSEAPPNTRYSRRRRVTMSHVNQPSQPIRTKTPERNPASLKSNSMHSRVPTRLKIMDQQSTRMSQSFHAGHTRRSTTHSTGNGPRYSRRSTTLSSSRSPSRSKLMGRSSNKEVPMGSQSFTAGHSRRSNSTMGFKRQGTPPENNNHARRRATLTHSRSPSRRKLLGKSNSQRALLTRKTPSQRNLLQGAIQSRSFHGPTRRSSSSIMGGSSRRNHNAEWPSSPTTTIRHTRRVSGGSGPQHHRHTSSGNNLNDFVTGSRIRRFDLDNFQYNVLGYR